MHYYRKDNNQGKFIVVENKTAEQYVIFVSAGSLIKSLTKFWKFLEKEKKHIQNFRSFSIISLFIILCISELFKMKFWRGNYFFVFLKFVKITAFFIRNHIIFFKFSYRVTLFHCIFHTNLPDVNFSWSNI